MTFQATSAFCKGVHAKYSSLRIYQQPKQKNTLVHLVSEQIPMPMLSLQQGNNELRKLPTIITGVITLVISCLLSEYQAPSGKRSERKISALLSF